jgi:hypothetical protein
MATESKPMDIEEEVDEIDQEIKKPEEEGQVAERELNYQRKPSAEDLKAPDVFSKFRKETLPIYRAITHDTPTGMPSAIDPKKPTLPEKEKKPEKGTQERHLLDNPDTSRFNFMRAMLELKSKVEGMPSGEKEKDETMRFDDSGRPLLNMEQIKAKIADLEKKLSNWNAKVNKKPNAKSPKRLIPTKPRKKSYTGQLLDFNIKLKRGEGGTAAVVPKKGQRLAGGGKEVLGSPIAGLNATSSNQQTVRPQHPSNELDDKGEFFKDKPTGNKQSKRSQRNQNTRASRAGTKKLVGGAMGNLNARIQSPKVVGAKGEKIKPSDKNPKQTRSGQQRSAKRRISLNVVRRSFIEHLKGIRDDIEFDSSNDPVGAGHGAKNTPNVNSKQVDAKDPSLISSHKPSMPTKKPAKRTGLGTSGLGAGVGAPITRANDREWFSEVYGI